MTSNQLPHNSAIQIDVPASIEAVGAVLDFVQTITTSLGFGVRDQNNIRLALEEISEYLGRTAFIEDSVHRLSFELIWGADGLIIHIKEKGLPIDLDNLPNYSPQALIENPDDESLSLHLARKAVDRLEFNNRGREGLEVILYKSFPTEKPASTEQSINQTNETDNTISQPEPISYRIRPPELSECIEISRCAYLVYGYTYEDYIYYPQHLAEMIQDGRLCSLLAVSEQGDVMGHCALKFTGENRTQAELGVLFVKPDYRKQGIGKALWAATVQHGRKMGLDGILVRSVTGHRASQNMAVSNGFGECALILALFPREVDIKNLGGLRKSKMSGLIQYLPVAPPRPRSIFCPDCYADQIADLYQSLNIPIAPKPPGIQNHQTSPILKSEVVPILNVANIHVSANGYKAERVARWAIAECRRFCRDKLDMVYLYTNLEDPGTPIIVEYCKTFGFILAGICPEVFQPGDALVLQYVNQPENPFDEMVVWTEQAARLRDWICSEWNCLDNPLEDDEDCL